MEGRDMKEFMKWAAIIAIIALILYFEYRVAMSDLPDWVKYILLK
jgi:hypothetical protein